MLAGNHKRLLKRRFIDIYASSITLPAMLGDNSNPNSDTLFDKIFLLKQLFLFFTCK